ncbi:MAG: tRNA pseudouridine(38-40) synthase TruA [Candidatus Omnitrophota bacterium]
MRNIKLAIGYEGTRYAGWQAQGLVERRAGATKRAQRKPTGKKKTIQELIEQALSRILQEKIKVIGSGRTDAGVHAFAQIANFKTNSSLACSNIHKGLNSLLPADIRISCAEEVASSFHSRFTARSKLYRYNIVNGAGVSPFMVRYAYWVRYPLDVSEMDCAAGYLLGRHNFRSFQAQDKKERPAIRTLKRLDITAGSYKTAVGVEEQVISIDIEADGFLYRMVRNIAGTLIEVGRGKLKPGEMKKILAAKNRAYAGPCAPAKGLCLVEVRYE